MSTSALLEDNEFQLVTNTQAQESSQTHKHTSAHHFRLIWVNARRRRKQNDLLTCFINLKQQIQQNEKQNSHHNDCENACVNSCITQSNEKELIKAHTINCTRNARTTRHRSHVINVVKTTRDEREWLVVINSIDVMNDHVNYES